MVKETPRNRSIKEKGAVRGVDCYPAGAGAVAVVSQPAPVLARLNPVTQQARQPLLNGRAFVGAPK